jgi:hypothetical protein
MIRLKHGEDMYNNRFKMWIRPPRILPKCSLPDGIPTHWHSKFNGLLNFLYLEGGAKMDESLTLQRD